MPERCSLAPHSNQINTTALLLGNDFKTKAKESKLILTEALISVFLNFAISTDLWQALHSVSDVSTPFLPLRPKGSVSTSHEQKRICPELLARFVVFKFSQLPTWSAALPPATKIAITHATFPMARQENACDLKDTEMIRDGSMFFQATKHLVRRLQIKSLPTITHYFHRTT